MAHRLDPLLRPASIAVLGASEREGTVGRNAVENLLQGGFEGALYAVNPGRKSVLRRALLSVARGAARARRARDLRGRRHAHRGRARRRHRPRRARRDDHVVARARERSATRRCASACSRRSAKPACVVCGANGMGFYNFADGIWGCGFKTRMHRRGGNVAYISHSGSGMCGIVDTEERIDFNLVVSTGPGARGRDGRVPRLRARAAGARAPSGCSWRRRAIPRGCVRALREARATRGIPVVALKVGRTELSAKLTVSHSGAIAGEDARLRRAVRSLRRAPRATTWTSSRRR